MSEHTSEGPAVKCLERSRSDRMLAGVCGGLARYFGIHPAFYRVGFVVLTLLGGAGVLIYLAAALVMPNEGEDDSIASGTLRRYRDRPWPMVGLGLLVVAGAVLLSRVTVWPRGDAVWVLLALAGAAIFLLTRHREAPAPAVAEPASGEPSAAVAPRPHRLGRTLAIAAGSLVAFVLVAAAIFSAVFSVHLNRGIGQRTYAPAAIADLNRSYRLGIGGLRLDLRDLQLPPGETRVSARVDIGDLRVIVPSQAVVQVQGDVRLGYLNFFGEENDGRNVKDSVTQAGKRVLVLRVHVGAGSVRVSRAVR